MDNAQKVVLHVEINQKEESQLGCDVIKEEVRKFLCNKDEIIPGKVYTGTVLPDHVSSFRVGSDCVYSDSSGKLNVDEVDLRFHVYQNYSSGSQLDGGSDVNEELQFLSWALPNAEFEGLWESLMMENELKNGLINYVKTTLLYSQNQVSPLIVTWNRLVFLHGPPGSGKTSLCKALAQKLSIRLQGKYTGGQLFEINSYALFSKWYSESAKLVFQMFNTIRQWLKNEEVFVCILINEVESLTMMRHNSQVEPVDSLRVVNTILTQLDILQQYRNVLVLSTSNVPGVVDPAFVDRADLKLFIGYPTKLGVYEILRSCIEELIHRRLIRGREKALCEASDLTKLTESGRGDDENGAGFEALRNSKMLLDLSAKGTGLSGRTLRKIPFLTSVRFVDKPNPDIQTFLSAMGKIVSNYKEGKGKFFTQESHIFSNGID